MVTIRILAISVAAGLLIVSGFGKVLQVLLSGDFNIPFLLQTLAEPLMDKAKRAQLISILVTAGIIKVVVDAIGGQTTYKLTENFSVGL